MAFSSSSPSASASKPNSTTNKKRKSTTAPSLLMLATDLLTLKSKSSLSSSNRRNKKTKNKQWPRMTNIHDENSRRQPVQPALHQYERHAPSEYTPYAYQHHPKLEPMTAGPTTAVITHAPSENSSIPLVSVPAIAISRPQMTGKDADQLEDLSDFSPLERIDSKGSNATAVSAHRRLSDQFHEDKARTVWEKIGERRHSRNSGFWEN